MLTVVFLVSLLDLTGTGGEVWIQCHSSLDTTTLTYTEVSSDVWFQVSSA